MTVKCLEADVASYRIVSYLGLRRYLKYRSLQRYDQPWGWKDPLNTFTLPLWLKVFPRAKILYIVRNGVDVAHSLVDWQRPIMSKREARNRKISAKFSLRRNLELFGFKGAARCLTLEGSFSLWEEFVAQAEDALARIDNDRKTIAYEKFLADPKPHLLELLRFCELNVDSGGIIDDVAKRINADRANAFLSNPALMTFYEKVKDSPWMLHYGYHNR
jgi:hypothetical protein